MNKVYKKFTLCVSLDKKCIDVVNAVAKKKWDEKRKTSEALRHIIREFAKHHD